MIYTLSSSLYLYKVNRNRSYYEEQVEKRRVFLLTIAIVVCYSAAIWFVFFG